MRNEASFLLGVALLFTASSTPAQTNLALGIQLYAGLTVTGAVGTVYSIQYVTNLAQTNSWVQLTNITLTSSPHVFLDASCPATGQRRFYRAVSVATNMVLIPAGSFMMGDAFSDGDTNERPTHLVYVSAFQIEKYEVTTALWNDVYQWAITHGYGFEYGGEGRAANHPVQTVGWYDAVKWCNARSEKAGRTPAYYTSSAQTTVYRTGDIDVNNAWVNWNAGYRLPTEAEWERAARGGLSGKRFPWGDTITHSQANYWSSATFAYDISPTRGGHPTYYDGVYPSTSPVGSFSANGYGLYDMTGNAYEWCWDWYASDYYSSSPGSNPRGPVSGSVRMERGGGWGYLGWTCRVAARFSGLGPTNTFPYGTGFRCVLPASP